MSHKSVVDQIKHYQRDIDNRPQDSARILRCIKILYNLPVTVRHLEETGIGKSVNALRKYGGETSDAAKALVLKWKAMVAEEERLEDEENDRTNNLNKESRNHSTSSSQDRKLKERDASFYNGKEKQCRESDSDHYSIPEKRLKLNEENISKEKRSKDNDYKHNNHHKSNSDRHSHHKDDKKNHSYSVRKHTKEVKRSDSYKRDKSIKENKERKHHSSSKSSHSIKEPTKEKRHHINESDEDSEGSVKRRKLKSQSPIPSDGSSDNEVNNGHVSGDESVSVSEPENSEEEEAMEAGEEQSEESEEEEGEEESEDEVRPNPYLDTFIKAEPESSEYEDDMLADVDIDDIDSENESNSGAPPESDAESYVGRENSDEEIDTVQNSRLSAESDTDEETQHKSKKYEKEQRMTNDNSHYDKKPSHKNIDKKHESHKLSKEENHKQLSSTSSYKSRHSVSHERSSSGGSSNRGSSNSKSSYSSKTNSSNSNNHKSSHNKNREHSKETSKVERSSHSVQNKEVKYKSETVKSKEDKHSKSDDKGEKNRCYSSSKHHSSSSALSSSSTRPSSQSSSSSSKDKKDKSRSISSSNHTNSSKSNKICGINSSKNKSDVQPTSHDSIKTEIKREPECSLSKSRKEISSKHSSIENNSKSDESKPLKVKQEVKIKTEKFSDNEDGIDAGSGASFADALLGMSGSVMKTKKKNVSSSNKKSSSSPSITYNKSEQHQSMNDKKPSISAHKSHSSNEKTNSKPDLLSKNIKLEPLEMDIASTLPEITPNYHPLPHYSPPPDHSIRRMKSLTEEEALSSIMSTKNQRTKVFSGNKASYSGSVPSLYSLCSHVILENIDALEYTGGVPYDLLKPVLERLTAAQLFNVENYNPYLIEDTDLHWKFHCSRDFRGEQRREMESWRELYWRCVDEREQRLEKLKANIKVKTAQRNEPVRKTKLAYVDDSFVKPPRNVARQQAKFGTSSATPSGSKHEIVAKAVVGGIGGPATKTVVPPPHSSSRSHQNALLLKKKKAPLMMKTLQFMKGNRFKR